MIERLTVAHVGRYKAIRLRALTSDPDPFWRTAAEEEAFSPEQWTSRLANEGRATFVATSGGGADVGLVSIGPPSWNVSADPLDYDLSSMWVAAEARGSAAARELVTAAVDFARGAGARRVTLWVLDGNARANAFYDKCGFTPTGRTGMFPPPRNLAEHERELSL
ncbi:GNAT family N-acetyltransferase [Spelaeicoccus albus]|uniref:Ribosomal protein S18 acetylase RimI-like enzyme n=1 Tax=Spelaeicoccus albus TaxID=1280376 RepID=A0A7Z0D0H0_9MICO|nr:GNAT family N-acetyltransferase [Spelaeicoccus albus]NYI67344.1 ribosomal protein S18 acetylase RimI-like enzyme [Spelaeicoccus albus]